MSRPFLALLAASICFVAGLGFFWLGEPPSNQELLANSAKVADYVRSACAVGGIPWWTSSYLQGCSLSFFSYTALTNLGLFLGSLAAGPHAGPKLAALAFLLLCPLTMFAFVRRLCAGSGWTAFACGCAYLFAPGLLLRAGHVEHVSIVMAFAMLPLAFLGVLVFLEDRNPRSAMFCAIGNALLVLAYAKIALLILPLLAGFALWALAARSHFELPAWRMIGLCLGAFFLLAVVPNLPATREMAFVAGFDFGPFAGWQRAFSAESVLAWMDRESWFSGYPGSSQNTIRTTGSYLGMAGLVCVAALFFLRAKPVWQSPEATTFRLFLALALLAQWLSFGVHSALAAQFAFLGRAGEAQDFAIAISWALFVLQGAVIFMIIPGSLPAKPWLAAAAIAVYFLVPGFRILEKLPLYGDIRAPQDFFQVGGVFCFAIAAGIAAVLVLREFPWPVVRRAAAVLLLVTAAADSALCVHSIFRSPMDRGTFEDFRKAQEFLAKSAVPGRVYPYSGRYFYLLTPELSGRSLATEAFNSYLAQREIGRLQQASVESKSSLLTFLKIAGVSFLVIDKKDPDTPQSLQDTLRPLFQTAYENEHFLILENPDGLAPAFYAERAEGLPDAEAETASRALEMGARGIAPISGLKPSGAKSSKPAAPAPFVRLAPGDVEHPSPHQFRITPPAKSGWLVLPEAYHPDWKASQNGRPLEVAPAFCGLTGIRLEGKPDAVELLFRPPWWFAASAITAGIAWILAIGFLVADRWKLIPATVRSKLETSPSRSTATVAPANPTEEHIVRKALVVIPTYNEAEGIRKIIERVLARDPRLEVLVVDDGSPDGTADIVRALAETGHPTGQRVHLLQRSQKLGLGSAYRAGFSWALDRDYDVCVEMDADFSHDPDDIPRLVEAVELGADVAVGSRYLDGVRVMNWPQDRLFLSLGASKFVRYVTGLPLTDATSGFKALRCATLRGLDWNGFKAQGYGFQIELHYFLWKSGAQLREVPIVFTERSEGKTKMTAKIAVEALLRVLHIAVTGK